MFCHVRCHSRSFAPLSHVSPLFLSLPPVISLVISQLPPSDLAGPWGTAIRPLLDTTASTSLVCCVTCWSSSPEDSVFFLIFLRFLLLPWPNHGVPAASSTLHLDRRCSDTFHGSASGSCTGQMTAFVEVTSITRYGPLYVRSSLNRGSTFNMTKSSTLMVGSTADLS